MRGNERGVVRGAAAHLASPHLSREEVMALLEVQRHNFDDAIARIERETTRKIKEAVDKTTELEKSLEFSQRQWEEKESLLMKMREENDLLRTQMASQNYEIKRTVNVVKELVDRIDYLDDYSRRNNLRISGIPEERQENWQQTQWKLTKFLREHFDVQPDFERVHRVGKPMQGKHRDIVARFARFTDRDAVFQERRTLAKTKTRVYINEDLCKNTVELRKGQSEKMKKAKANGQIAYFSYRKLVIRDRQGNSQEKQTPEETRASAVAPSPSESNTTLPDESSPASFQEEFPTDAHSVASRAPTGCSTSTSHVKEAEAIHVDKEGCTAASTDMPTYARDTHTATLTQAADPTTRLRKQPDFYKA